MSTGITPFFFIGDDMTKKIFLTLAAGALAIAMAACGGGDNTGKDGAGAGREVREKRMSHNLKGRQNGDFTYDLNAEGNGIVITSYIGTGGVVGIPDKIEDIPVVEIGENAFRGRSREKDALKPGDNVTSVVIPEGVKIIGRGAFSDCRDLVNVTLPDTVREIREVAFRGCSSLRTANIPAGLEHMGLNAFFRNGELAKLIIPDRVSVIEWQGWNHFSGCVKLPPETRQRLKEIGYPADF